MSLYLSLENESLREQLEAANKRIADAPHADTCAHYEIEPECIAGDDMWETPECNCDACVPDREPCNCWKSKDADK